MNQNPDLCPDCPTPLTCEWVVGCIREPDDKGCFIKRRQLAATMRQVERDILTDRYRLRTFGPTFGEAV